MLIEDKIVNTYLEKKIYKYAIATLDSPTTYLKSMTKGQYIFVYDIEAATKTLKKSIAETVLMDYYRDYGQDVPMVIIPIAITYDILELNEVD